MITSHYVGITFIPLWDNIDKFNVKSFTNKPKLLCVSVKLQITITQSFQESARYILGHVPDQSAFCSNKNKLQLGPLHFSKSKIGECQLFDTDILQTREFADLSQHLWSSQVAALEPNSVLTLLMHLSPHQKLFGWPGAQAVWFMAAPSDHIQLEGVL